MKRLFRECLIIILLALCAVSLVGAQAFPRDYVVSKPSYSFSDDNTTFRVQVLVGNQGGDGTTETLAILTNATTNRVISELEVPPLKSGESRTVIFELKSADYDPGNQEVFRIEVGIDNFELAGSSLAENNAIIVSVPIPTEIGSTPAPESTPDPDAPFFEVNRDGSFDVAGRSFSQLEILMGALILVGILMLFWVLTLILRLIFKRPPRMGVWQPAYANVPPLDPNSLGGRRQSWQMHAQNGLLLAPNVEDTFHPVKLLLGMDGLKLGNWKITGVRLSQYDTYGRLTRTNTLADDKQVKQLNKLISKRNKLSEDKLRKQIKPIIRGIVKGFKKKVTKKTAFLPIALDLRLEGMHGEVRILFELYTFRQNQWERLDQWEPEMQLVGQKLMENYTFTVHGQGGTETYKDFLQRLEEDIHWLMCETIILPVPQNYAEPLPRPYDIPDTLSGMPAING